MITLGFCDYKSFNTVGISDLREKFHIGTRWELAIMPLFSGFAFFIMGGDKNGRRNKKS